MRSPVATGCGGSRVWKSFGEIACAWAARQAAERARPSRRLRPIAAKSTATRAGPLFLLAQGVGQVVDRLEHAVRRAALLGADGIAAVHGHLRRAADLVGRGHLRGAAHLALHAERLHGVAEFLRVDALLLEPGEEVLLHVGAQAVL